MSTIRLDHYCAINHQIEVLPSKHFRHGGHSLCGRRDLVLDGIPAACRQP
jgi:hypothetical protein